MEVEHNETPQIDEIEAVDAEMINALNDIFTKMKESLPEGCNAITSAQSEELVEELKARGYIVIKIEQGEG